MSLGVVTKHETLSNVHLDILINFTSLLTCVGVVISQATLCSFDILINFRPLLTSLWTFRWTKQLSLCASVHLGQTQDALRQIRSQTRDTYVIAETLQPVDRDRDRVRIVPASSPLVRQP